MTQEKFDIWDKRAYIAEVIGFAAFRLLLIAGLVCVLWTTGFATWQKIILSINIGYLLDFGLRKLIRWYIARVLSKFSPMWRDVYAEWRYLDSLVR